MRKILIVCAMAGLAACTGPMYVTSVPSYNNTIYDVMSALESQGYTFTGREHEIRNTTRQSTPPFEGNVNSSNWIPLEYVNVDTYRFADSTGNTMSFTVEYRSSSDHTNGTIYYSDVQTAGCSTSNSEDYERLCGDRSPIRMFDTIKKDMTVKP